MFERTRVKLTAWYLLIIMIISLLFSLIIYSMVNVEFIRFEQNQIRLQKDIMQNKFIPAPRVNDILFVDIHEARIRLITRLGILNLGILIFAGGAGYFLAGRTLRPIKESMDEQNRFISDSSHELRTPLTSLRSEIEVNLLNKNLTVAKAKSVLKSNLDEVISLQILSDRLLELSENRELINKNNLSKISIKEVLETATKKAKKIADTKQIQIETNIADKKILGDFDRLVEAFVILLDNAIKYSPKKSNIQLISKTNKNRVQISVIDSGIGINDEDINHIFDRFYRAEKSRNEDGFGLGLSIAKKIINSHNGEISAKSNSKKGSTFIVELPA